MSFHIYVRDVAGVVCFGWRDKAVHLFVKKDQRQWGYREDWYDGPLCSFGVGPFLLVTWGPYWRGDK